MAECPLCGGGIHPIAGRCKHCKTDLVKLRAQQNAATMAAQAQIPVASAAPTATPTSTATTTVTPATPTVAPATPTATTTVTPANAESATPHAPALMYRQDVSSWSRRWPYAVAAVAVIAILLSVVVMVQQWTSDSTKTAPSSVEKAQTPAAAPAAPDSADPTSPMKKNSKKPPQAKAPSTAPSAPPARTGAKAPGPGQFAVALTQRVCTKLSSCGLLTSFSQMMCTDLANQLGDPDAADKVKRGECRYDRSAAAACLSAIGGLSCSAQSTSDVMSWVTRAGALADCASAYTCN